MVNSSVSAACNGLLDQSTVYHPLYGEGLSNHLPMALIALDRMGASPDQLRSFFETYRRRLRVRHSTRACTDPRSALGMPEQFENVCAWFNQRIAQSGTCAVLSTWLPELMGGVGASAFHALIRLAYAVEADHPAEIAMALAYWTTAHQQFGSLGTSTQHNLSEVAATCAQEMTDHSFSPGLIVDRMAEVASIPAIASSATQPASLSFEGISDFALDAYHAREDFILLHLVTACHAFSVLREYICGNETALRHFWHAVLMAYLSTGQSPADESTARDFGAAGWPECLQRACASRDDHTIKLVYSAWRRDQSEPDPRYPQIASRRAFA